MGTNLDALLKQLDPLALFTGRFYVAEILAEAYLRLASPPRGCDTF